MKDQKLRSVNTHFWDDEYIQKLDPSQKLLFLYLLTNPLTNLIGVYEISIRRMGFDTGFDKDALLNMLDRFAADDKIYYHDSYIILSNFLKNQRFNANMQKGANQRIEELPNEIKAFILGKGLKGFETIRNHSKGFEIVRKEEDEDEVEDEVEVEDEDEDEGKKTPPTSDSIFISLKNLPKELNDEIYLSKVAAYGKTTSARAQELIPEFIAFIEFDPEKNYRPLGKHLSHFQYWVKKHLVETAKEEKNGNNSKNETKRDRRIRILNDL